MGKDISLVLSSGGARGIAHIGAIEELLKNGYNIKSVSGTSMGALVGGIYATGHFEEYKEWMISLKRKDVFNLIDISISNKGFVKGDRVIEHMKEIIPDMKIEDMKIPFSAIATDIKKGEQVVFDKGNLFEAIRASISIPAVFTPVKSGDTFLIDGGVLNPLPCDKVKRFDNSLLVIVDVNSRNETIDNFDIKEKESNDKENIDEGTIKSKINNIIAKGKSEIHETFENFIPKSNSDRFGFFNLSNKSISLMIQRITELSIEKYNPDIVIKIPRDSFGTYDFYKSEQLIDLGREATKFALKKLNEKEASS